MHLYQVCYSAWDDTTRNVYHFLLEMQLTLLLLLLLPPADDCGPREIARHWILTWVHFVLFRFEYQGA